MSTTCGIFPSPEFPLIYEQWYVRCGEEKNIAHANTLLRQFVIARVRRNSTYMCMYVYKPEIKLNKHILEFFHFVWKGSE